MWRLTAGRTLLATDDAGQTWRRIAANVVLDQADTVLFTTATTGWESAAGGNAVRYTRDSGRRWTTIDVPR